VAPSFSPETLAASLAELIPSYPDAALCVALSGGVDSVALLHAGRALVSGEPRLRLRALQVDHGLQEQSKDWTAHCRMQCDSLGVTLRVLELKLDLPKGTSVEAEARRARYAALAAALESGEFLLTGHHADDQLETVLLQLFRGAGVAGLAAMPARAPLGPGFHLRPLLSVERSQLEAYAAASGLSWVEDPMNLESRYDRAYLRHGVLPAVRARWPALARTVGRSAGHFATAQRLLEALAAADSAPLLDAQGRLETAGLVTLPRDRQFNLLRWWIVRQGLGLPSTARLEAIVRDVVPARDDAQPVVTWPTGEVRRYRRRLYAMQPLGPLPPRGWKREIRPGGTIELPPGLGSLSLKPVTGRGIALARAPGTLLVTFRAGDRSAPGGGRDGWGDLGNLFREFGVVPWMRERLPLVSCENQLVAIADLWVRRSARATHGEAGFQALRAGGPPAN
jgi:tRNA(Ile)-lysidine synthase